MEQLEVERRIGDIMSAARRQAVDELESYHAFGRKFTKFDDFEPLERQDADTTRRLEREAILGVEEFDPRVVVGRFACSATHLGEWRGHPPTGRRFENVDEVYFFRFSGDRIASAWGIEDTLDRFQQLALDPNGP